jgi:hypothetical protein
MCVICDINSYNSSIYGALAAQDYRVTVTSSLNGTTSDTPGWKTLENKEWSNIYATSSVPGYSDIHLMVDRVSFDVEILKNWTYALKAPNETSCGGPTFWLRHDRLEATFSPDWYDSSVIQTSASRAMVDLEDLRIDVNKFPSLQWPVPYDVRLNSSQSLHDYFKVCLDDG